MCHFRRRWRCGDDRQFWFAPLIGVNFRQQFGLSFKQPPKHWLVYVLAHSRTHSTYLKDLFWVLNLIEINCSAYGAMQEEASRRQPCLSWLPKLTDGTLSLKRGGWLVLYCAVCYVHCDKWAVCKVLRKFPLNCATVPARPGHTIPIGLIKKPQEL